MVVPLGCWGVVVPWSGSSCAGEQREEEQRNATAHEDPPHPPLPFLVTPYLLHHSAPVPPCHRDSPLLHLHPHVHGARWD